MDKREFIQNVIEQVREIPISSIVETKIHLEKRAGLYKGLCPFHNDHHLGSFVVSDRKGIFKCFSCGEGGDSISFIMKIENLNYVESAMKIALNHGIISCSEYEEFFNRKYSNKKSEQIERIYKDKDKDKFKMEIASITVLNNVFTAFISESPLSSEHKQYLMEERGLSEEDIIEGGYFSFPTRRIMKDFLNNLKNNYGYEPTILKNVPGFYYDKENSSYTFTKNKGIGIAIKNADRLIAGIQIRRDKSEENKSRYIWFSSAFIEYDEKLAEKYEQGTSSGSPIDVVYPKKVRNATIFITEGRFKAKQIADTYGSISISVQGVGSWRNITSEIRNIQKHVSFRLKNIYVAYDADMAYNVQVFRQALKMTNNLKNEFGKMSSVDKNGKEILDENGQSKSEDVFKISYVMWLVDYGKGIDDLIIAGHKEMLDKMPKDDFDKLYKDFIREVENKYGDISKNKVPKEILREYFDAMVIPEFKGITKYITSINQRVS